MSLDALSNLASEAECLSFLGELGAFKNIRRTTLISQVGKENFFILTLEDGHFDDEKLMEYATIIQNGGLVNIEECIFHLENINPGCRRLKPAGIKQFEIEKLSIA